LRLVSKLVLSVSEGSAIRWLIGPLLFQETRFFPKNLVSYALEICIIARNTPSS
jgi:hypothetical protein